VTHLRVGLSGCGRRGALAIANVRTHGHCDVVALHDPDAAALQRLGDGSGVATRVQDFEALLASGIDFVVLAGPCGDRARQVEAAAAQGVHCLLHAPMAPDVAAGAAMVAACEQAGVKLGVVVPEQSDPALEQIRQMLADDWLGAPVLVTAVHADDAALQSPPPAGHWLRDPARAGAGALVQLGTEQVHLASWLVGRAPLQVTVQATSGFSVLAQDGAVATVLLRGGVLCTFASSHLARGSAFAIHGTDGAVHVLPDRLSLRGRKEWRGDVFDYPAAGEELTLLRADLARAPGAADFELHGRFARWIDDRDDFPCPGDQALQDMRLLDAVARSLASGRTEPVQGTGA
jgi:predicted dehydrogenase